MTYTVTSGSPEVSAKDGNLSAVADNGGFGITASGFSAADFQVSSGGLLGFDVSNIGELGAGTSGSSELTPITGTLTGVGVSDISTANGDVELSIIGGGTHEIRHLGNGFRGAPGAIEVSTGGTADTTIDIDTRGTLSVNLGDGGHHLTGKFQQNAYVHGGGGDDTITMSSHLLATGTDTIYGGGGDDTIFGSSRWSDLYGGAGNDIIDTGFGNNNVQGNGGDDTIIADFGNDSISGGAGNDSVDAGNGRDKVSGGSGDDILNGGRQDDSISGGAGNDTLNGDRGSDILNGSSGDDVLNGGTGSDVLNGGDGSDILTGNSGADILNGGAGIDRLHGGAGDDTLTGGEGRDFFQVALTGAGDDIVTDYGFRNEGDAISVKDSTVTGLTIGGSQQVTLTAGTTSLSVDGSGGFAIHDAEESGSGASFILDRTNPNPNNDYTFTTSESDGRIDDANMTGENNAEILHMRAVGVDSVNLNSYDGVGARLSTNNAGSAVATADGDVVLVATDVEVGAAVSRFGDARAFIAGDSVLAISAGDTATYHDRGNVGDQHTVSIAGANADIRGGASDSVIDVTNVNGTISGDAGDGNDMLIVGGSNVGDFLLGAGADVIVFNEENFGTNAGSLAVNDFLVGEDTVIVDGNELTATAGSSHTIDLGGVTMTASFEGDGTGAIFDLI